MFGDDVVKDQSCIEVEFIEVQSFEICLNLNWTIEFGCAQIIWSFNVWWVLFFMFENEPFFFKKPFWNSIAFGSCRKDLFQHKVFMNIVLHFLSFNFGVSTSLILLIDWSKYTVSVFILPFVPHIDTQNVVSNKVEEIWKYQSKSQILS